MTTATRVDDSQLAALAGPGTHLHCLLAGWGIRPCAGCGCDDKAAAMDAHGPAWCREHLETIVDWLMEPARARLLLGAFIRIAPEAARDFARDLVLEAITLAEGGQP